MRAKPMDGHVANRAFPKPSQSCKRIPGRVKGGVSRAIEQAKQKKGRLLPPKKKQRILQGTHPHSTTDVSVHVGQISGTRNGQQEDEARRMNSPFCMRSRDGNDAIQQMLRMPHSCFARIACGDRGLVDVTSCPPHQTMTDDTEMSQSHHAASLILESSMLPF
mmetsp:Transcript_5795/g.35979  ORF Transcript_5795/g.35979 Transcript_5795/m.35979 type:complete len:163 (+) Transcript_5795:97-585(+)|eukprot:CAMPEP_0113928062 /NCGR_PEP_ID=MMETSP1159-20121227/4626_1 /TAXON_ID=88271 /ORGANISM="Picocystis salinarum" /LENGTH=162 /DNA_ID=CAMNT_0000928573 /DNA_START=35 /DNA_END=523 /DNA_ORIENTATION=+ /assembly_acc=CAM_ASM_000767